MTASQIAVTETWEDVKNMVYRIIHRHIKRRGGQWDDLVSVAHEAYMRAYTTHDPDKGAFTTHCWHTVQGWLNHHADSERRHAAGAIPLHAEAAPEGFDADRFIGELSEDAGAVARLVIESPAEIGTIYRQRGLTCPGRIGSLRSAAIQYLREIGWTARRIAESFAEVREALAS